MAKSFIRKFVKWFFISLNLLISAVFLVACLSPFLNPHDWNFVGFFALLVPYLAIALILFIIFWLIVKPVRALIAVGTLLIGWKQLSVIEGWHFSQKFNEEQKADSIMRIITWNIRGMYGLSNSSYTQERNRTEIVALINRLNADVVCMQEFNNSTYKDPIGNNIPLFMSKFPYYFFSKDDGSRNRKYLSGNIIFSKSPIIDSGRTPLKGTFPESLIYADIVRGKDTIRIFTTHLQSFQFTTSDYKDIQSIKEQNDETFKASENIYIKMRT